MDEKKNDIKEQPEILLNNYNYALNEEFNYLDKIEENKFLKTTKNTTCEIIQNKDISYQVAFKDEIFSI